MSIIEKIMRLYKLSTLHSRLIFIGCIISLYILFSIFLASKNNYYAFIGVSLLIFICAWSVGATIGLLISMPIATRKYENKISENSPNTNSNRFVENNKSFEKITDALVIFIAGIATTQISRAREYIVDFQEFLIAHPINCLNCNKSNNLNYLSVEIALVGPFLLILGLTFGFICGFLFTHMKLIEFINDRENQIESGKTATDKVSVTTIEKALGELDNNNIKNSNLTKIWKIDKSINSSLDVMEELLYQPNSEDKILEISGQLSLTAAINISRYWVLTACAFGQKLSKITKNNKNSDEYLTAKTNALDCIKRAIRIDPKSASWIISLAQPNNPDNDLKALYSDPDFHRIVTIGY